jgi:uncharacterized LabA/DUF88 family protein
LNIAVFIDFDNIEIGVRTTLNQQFDVGKVLEAIKERGEIVSKIAYSDWTRAGDYSRHLTQHAIRLVQRNLTPGGDKNGADINMALDALEMAFTHQHINAYVIVGGDSDFLSLVEKLKQYDKKVFVVGGRAFTSVILQRNCHEFIAYENLSGVRRAANVDAGGTANKGGRPVAPLALSPLTQAYPIVRRALKILSDREVSPQTGLLKSTLLQLDSTFSERNYGASSFLDFTEKLAHAGLVHLKTSGRSVMVELNPQFEDGETTEQKAAAGAATADVPPAAAPEFVQPANPVSLPAATESAADGVRFVTEVLQKATSARWPMYIRNVKQLLRAADSTFDERRYGFGGLMDLLRACQRDSVMRLERDRRGGLRVFPGAALQRPIEAPSHPVLQPAPTSDSAPDAVVDVEIDDGAGQPFAPVEVEPVEVNGNVIDTTAELLGRAKARKPRAKAPNALGTRRTTRAASPGPTRKPAGKRTRAKKASVESGDDNS